jgi:hypothetical protein
LEEEEVVVDSYVLENFLSQVKVVSVLVEEVVEEVLASVSHFS